MKNLAIAAKVAASIAIWSLTIVLLSVCMNANEWFWYHYIGTMDYQTYSLIEGVIGICAFLLAIVAIAGAGGATAYMFGAFSKRESKEGEPQ